MSAPPMIAEELDPEDLVAEPEERSTSQTRRMGSNAQAALEIELRKAEAADPALPSAGIAPGAQAVADPPSGADPPATSEAKAEGAPPLTKPYLAGDVIAGKYKLTRIIGRGGMGAVWRAHNIPLDIDVAIKLIRRDRTAAGAAERLLTEARAAARLMHPSIVRVFDFGESEQGDPFIVMELLHGEALSAILRRKKRITPAVAVQTLLPVAAALASAHGKGIVHRDLKPDNIIVVGGENGALQPKIVDFGIAKLLDMDRQVTLAGEVLGSPDYMSPEQARGAENVGEATDIWALSVVLYEAISGARPFDGANYNALIASILTNDPAPLTAHGVGDGALAAIIAQGLAKDVSARWQRMRDLGAALASWAVERGIEDDVAGNSIAKQWLAATQRRLLTVQPEDFSAPAPRGPLPAAGAPAPGMAGAPALQAMPAPTPRPAMETMIGRPRRAPRLVWIVPLIAVLALAGTAIVLSRDRIAELFGESLAASASAEATAPSASGASGASGSMTAAPSATVAEGASSAPSADAPGASADPDASAAPSASAPQLRPWGRSRRKIRAPHVPKHIKF
jgi:eukaryotic-like serine/threonine-protein kinase